MKPRSLASESNAANPALRSGYQAIQEKVVTVLELPVFSPKLKKLDAIRAIISMLEEKAITSHGIT